MGRWAVLGAVMLVIGTAADCRAQEWWIGAAAGANVDATWTATGHDTSGALTLAGGRRVSRHADVRVQFDLPASATTTIVDREPSLGEFTLTEDRRNPALTVAVGVGPTHDRWTAGVTGGLAIARHESVTHGTLAGQIYAQRTDDWWLGPAFGAYGEYRLTPHLGVTVETRVIWFPSAAYGRDSFIVRSGAGLRYRF